MKEIKELKQIIVDLPNIKNSNGEKECYNLLASQINKLTEIRKEFTKEEDKRVLKLFRDEILELIFMSDLGRYIYEKPRGYAGDFVTQEIIWNGCTDIKHRYKGINEIGRIISACSFDMENCRANESRVYFLKKEISKAGNRLTSIGCGSCIEYWNAHNDLPEGLDVFCLDQDNGAFDSAKNHISPNGNSYNFHQDNILKFILNKDKIKKMGVRNLIYSFGLLDYFNIQFSRKIVSNLWDAVKPGGLIMITNAHPDNPTRTWIEYAGDWFLCYKTKEQMYVIIDKLQNIDKVEYIMDDYNVYQYLKVWKK